jgi:hypothetical protein
MATMKFIRPVATFDPCRIYDSRSTRCDSCERRIKLTHLYWARRVSDGERVEVCASCATKHAYA